MGSRIRRLEIAVVILSIMFLGTLGMSVYCAVQMEALVAKVPSYHEIKEDIKTLNKMYKVSEVQVPKAYNYTKEKIGNGYDSVLVMSNQLVEQLKKKWK